MLDREVAWRAGVGFFGKNTNVLTSIGSWVFLGQVITDLDLPPDRPSTKSCGACTACMPACPTGAIVAPYVIDSNRCIAYLTIEHRGAIRRDLRALMGDRVFGCDICQEVCPVNVTRGTPTEEPAYRAPQQFSTLDLEEVLALDEEAFRQRFQGSPIRRATRVGLQRNACVVLGNLGDASAVPALERALHGRTWCGVTPPGLSAACRGRRRRVRCERRSRGRPNRGCGRRSTPRCATSRLRTPKRAAASGTAAARALGPAVLWRPRLGPSSGLRTLRPRPRATPWAPTGPPPALRPPAARPSGVETTPSALHSRSPPPTSHRRVLRCVRQPWFSVA